VEQHQLSLSFLADLDLENDSLNIFPILLSENWLLPSLVLGIVS